MTITIDGYLECDAHAGATLAGDSVLTLLVTAGMGWPFEISHTTGNGAADHIATQRLARSMRKGAPCVVRAGMARARSDHGWAVIVLADVALMTVGGHVVVA